MTLTKAKLADELMEKIGFNNVDAKQIVEIFFEEIRQALADGETVKLTGFGKFEVRHKRERPGRNPVTLEAVPIKARKVVTFHPSKKVKALIDEVRRKGRNGP